MISSPVLETALSQVDFAEVEADCSKLEPGHSRLWKPNGLLVESVVELEALVPVQRCLDLGCGSGRDAVYLALRGWDVIAVDRLPRALAKARALAMEYGVTRKVKPLHTVLDDVFPGSLKR